MTAADFSAWVALMKATRGWSKTRCASELDCGINQIARWSRTGAPGYIALACSAICQGFPPWRAL